MKTIPVRGLIEGYKLSDLRRVRVLMDCPPLYEKGDEVFIAPNGKKVLCRPVDSKQK